MALPDRLGEGTAYWRTPYDADCELDTGMRVDANELSRPHEGRGRPHDLPPR